MLTLTPDQFARGWRYALGGYRLTVNAISVGVVRRIIDWDDPDSVPVWIGACEGLAHTKEMESNNLEEAMAYVEATYELKTI